jgi:hypothetical protein
VFDLKLVCAEITEGLSEISGNTYLDISDLGNEIGFIVAKYFDESNTKKDFLRGVEHGISITDGTHG